LCCHFTLGTQRCGRCERSLWDFLKPDGLVFEGYFVNLVYIEVDAEAVVFLFGEEQEDFWVGNLRALREERHLRLKRLENVRSDFGFVALGSDDVVVDFSFFDEFYSFSEVSI